MKKCLSLFLSLCLAVSLCACTAPAGKTEPTAASLPAETAPVQAEAAETNPVPETTQTQPEDKVPAYPRTVTDQGGRTVTIPERPERIVSGYYISSSAVIALGLKDRMVGIEAKADKRVLYRLTAPELMALPSVGTAKEFDLEGCIALEPNLVILPLRLKAAAESLEELGIPVVLVNPESQELMLSMAELIAEAAGVEPAAAELREFVEEQAEKLSSITGDRPTVYLGGNSSFLSTAGGNMYQSDLISMAGGINVARELTDSNWAEISYEQLLTWDPEYIIMAADASYSLEDVMNDPNLADCRAVREGHVFHMPNDLEAWDSPIPGGILGAVWTASVLHGDQVTKDDAAAAAAEFYERFYGFIYEMA